MHVSVCGGGCVRLCEAVCVCVCFVCVGLCVGLVCVPRVQKGRTPVRTCVLMHKCFLDGWTTR